MRTLPIPRSLQGRLLLIYLVLGVLGIGGLILWTGFHLQTAAIEQAEHDLELEALIIANALREPLDDWSEGDGSRGRSLDALTRSYAANTGARITVIDPSFRVVLSSDDQVSAHLEHNHIEIVAARAGNEQHDIRWDEWDNEQRLFVAAPIWRDENELDGIVQLSVPMAPLYAAIRRTWLSLMMVGGVVLLITVLVSLLLARNVTRPIRSLTAVTEAMAAGDLDQQVSPAGPDEVERLGRAFNRMAGRVQEILARQQAFVANAAHELRSPLASLRLRIELLQQHGRNDPELTQRYLQQMDEEVEHLGRMVDHLLALSRLDEGEELPRSPVDLAPLLYEVADELAPLVRTAGLDLRVDVPPHLPVVLANAESMHMVVRNLLDNAVKYTSAGGQVTLCARVGQCGTDSEEAKQQAVSNEHRSSAGRQPHRYDSQTVVIEVSDTGPGIAAEHLPHVFERFYRVHETGSPRPAGAGLGLSLVRSTIEAHQGTIEARSGLGRGTTFLIRLPVMSVPTIENRR